MKKYGVIDLGTNTFHLLIVNHKGSGQFQELYRERIFVKLAEEGIGKIGVAAFERALSAMTHYQNILKAHGVKDVRAFGTAALRTASNSEELVSKIGETTGIVVKVIPGTKEAELIHQGVSLAIPFGREKGLIMDIGGGSVEFILANQDKVFWSGSFPIGVAVLYHNFQKNDPISRAEVQNINDNLFCHLEEMLEVLKTHRPQQLIGASGTFDVLENLLGNNREQAENAHILHSEFYDFYEKLILSNLQERLKIPGLPSSRAELIIVAIILIRFILQHTSIPQIRVSPFSMKEGIIQQMAEEHSDF